MAQTHEVNLRDDSSRRDDFEISWVVKACEQWDEDGECLASLSPRVTFFIRVVVLIRSYLQVLR